MNELAYQVVTKLAAKNQTLAAVESFTGGQFASAITAIPGASFVFHGGIIPYQTSQKVDLLGLDESELLHHGVVSSWCAKELALRGHQVMKADYVVSFTGNAGPSSCDHQPVGRVYLGFHYPQGERVLAFDLTGTRAEIQASAVTIALRQLLDWMQ